MAKRQRPRRGAGGAFEHVLRLVRTGHDRRWCARSATSVSGSASAQFATLPSVCPSTGRSPSASRTPWLCESPPTTASTARCRRSPRPSSISDAASGPGFLDGYSADRLVDAEDRDGLERLCRYGARSPIANSRLSRDPSGRVVMALKRPLRGGPTELAFTPVEFLRRLATLIPPPRSHLTRYHGVFAPHHALRGVSISRRCGGASNSRSRRRATSSAAPHATTSAPPIVHHAGCATAQITIVSSANHCASLRPHANGRTGSRRNSSSPKRMTASPVP